ncbi:MAG: sulfite exporter TauE/SafE family protein [Candidatus Thermoplasmatota archaeon]|nr:sulfite exporter TauE/SafE family protein [Candidatus Thermoplasmatota archaeon]
MTDPLGILIMTAASIGFIHTLFGPDHYLPFIMMARAGNWSMKKTSLVTVLCGFGHVMSSVVIGSIGIALGIAVSRLEVFEGVRGNLAAWALIAFGLVYMIWGIRRAWKHREHTHSHTHMDRKKTMTVWVLFTIFVLGPCEPLIPLLMYPAYERSFLGIILVAGVFSIATIGTMLFMVIYLSLGLKRLRFEKLEHWTHAIAGAVILISGLGIQFLGL